MIDARRLIPTHDVLLMTLDTLRYDVAQQTWREGGLPNLSAWLPKDGWEQRHTPGNFTYAAHQAFFAGFLPTPARPGRHPRLFAAAFAGSETTSEQTCVFDAPDMVAGFAARGYHTVCIGGVGFFNPISPLGRTLPGLFAESYWREEFGVTEPRSTEHQVRQAVEVIGRLAPRRRLFLFINISAIHQPNCFYLPGATSDSPRTQRAALEYVDRHLPPLFEALVRRAGLLAIICSDHGAAYGEGGYRGHRLNHPVVWNVPYAEFVLPGESAAAPREAET